MYCNADPTEVMTIIIIIQNESSKESIWIIEHAPKEKEKESPFDLFSSPNE